MRSLADAANISHQRDPARFEGVVQNIIAGIIDIGIDLVGGEVPGPKSEADADVTADLADPDRLALEPVGSDPETQMKALIDGFACLLQGKILTPSIDVKWTHWRVKIRGTEQKRPGSAETRLQTDGLCLIPAWAKPLQDRVELANHHQVERITFPVASVVSGTPRQLFQDGFQLGFIAFNLFRLGEKMRKLPMTMVDAKTRHGDGKGKITNLLITLKPYHDQLGSLVVRDKDKALGILARPDQSQGKGTVLKVGVDGAIGKPGGHHLERQQQQQR